MNIKELRSITKLNQKEFSNLYKIPLKTLQNWESSPDSNSYRKCPIYFYHLLRKAIINDFKDDYLTFIINSFINTNDLKVSSKHLKCLKFAIGKILTSNLINYIEDIVFYGSLTRNQLKETSDIDILLVLNESFKQIENYNLIITKLKGSVSSDNYLEPEADLHIAYLNEYQNSKDIYYLNVRKDGLSIWN